MSPLITVWWRSFRPLRTKTTPQLQWGRFRIPLALAPQHFMVCGQTRSGKSVLTRLFMQSAFERIGAEGNSAKMRALVYDGKPELLGAIYGMRTDEQTVYVTNPWCRYAARWDIAADVTGPGAARELGAILFPADKHEPQKFFSLAVGNIAAAVMEVLWARAGTTWRFSHLIYVMRSAERIREVLQATESGRDFLANMFREGETLDSVIATVESKLADYITVAALWDHASSTVSLSQWADSSSVLVMQHTPHATTAMRSINRAMFHRASQILRMREPADVHTWVILDEVHTAGRLEGLADLLSMGGGLGVSVLLAFQNVNGLLDEYGEYETNQMIGNVSTKAFLRFEDRVNADWAASFFGKEEVRLLGVNGHAFTRETVMASELHELTTPRVHRRHDIQAYFIVPEGDPPLMYRDSIPGGWLFDTDALAPVVDVPDWDPPGTYQSLQCTMDEIRRLLRGNRRTLTDRFSSTPADVTGAPQVQRTRPGGLKVLPRQQPTQKRTRPDR